MANPQYVYTMSRLSKAWPGGKEVLKDISLSFLPGAKIGVLGINGAGKSTLLRIMAGIETEFQGEAWAADGIKIGFLPQEPELDANLTVLENVMLGMGEAKQLVDRFNEISAKFGEEMSDDEMNALIMEQGELQEKIDAADAWDLERKASIAMDALRLPPSDWGVENLSGGEKRRVALCQLLLSAPDILLLDHDFPGTVVTITHDRYFLDEVAGWILELDRGHGIPYQGNYSGWLEQKQKRLEQEGRTEEAKNRVLARELEWVRSAPRARQAKSKARLQAYEQLLEQQHEAHTDAARIHIPPGPRLGNVVIEASGLNKAFSEKLLIDNLDFRLPPGGIVGVVGPNGAGKTTLFRMLTGQDTPDAGELKVGETVKMAYVDQSRDALDNSKTVWEVISDGHDEIELGKRVVASRAYVGQFNFRGSDQQKRVGQLSGGERNRVHLARMLKSGCNLLLLDEPTNDLDVDTLRALEEALLEFGGCAVVITHDRWFLDRIATHILAFEGNSHVEWFEGNWQSYEEDRRRRLGASADQPTRIKYKPISR
ncbi:MAG: energy-dependent translational throttle protein EttA [Alphaproteobacteria bacterium]|nr:energy-dependent translational throttle protein EttA [Alphaproteobacteria bacterium]